MDEAADELLNIMASRQIMTFSVNLPSHLIYSGDLNKGLLRYLNESAKRCDHNIYIISYENIITRSAYIYSPNTVGECNVDVQVEARVINLQVGMIAAGEITNILGNNSVLVKSPFMHANVALKSDIAEVGIIIPFYIAAVNYGLNRKQIACTGFEIVQTPRSTVITLTSMPDSLPSMEEADELQNAIAKARKSWKLADEKTLITRLMKTTTVKGRKWEELLRQSEGDTIYYGNAHYLTRTYSTSIPTGSIIIHCSGDKAIDILHNEYMKDMRNHLLLLTFFNKNLEWNRS